MIFISFCVRMIFWFRYFIISGEKIYIVKEIEPSRINGFGNLTVVYNILTAGEHCGL